MTTPKLFISYSWTTPEHERWVIRLAEELMESGVDIILDKWDLKQGHDANAFMEKMVSDPEITKVIMVIDKNYADKANGRTGGVGTETQIISKEVYEKQQQDKFVAIVLEKNEEGKPCLPIYYGSKVYIDFCESEKYSERFEELVRWIFDKPLHVKPELGKPPSYIVNDLIIPKIPTSVIFNRALDAIKNGKSNVLGCINEYLEKLSEGLEKFRINDFEGEYDDVMIECIENFIPYRNEFIQLLFALGNYAQNIDYIDLLHKFFEGLIRYQYRPQDMTAWKEIYFDNFKFIIHELFLYTITIFLKKEKFAQVNFLIEKSYYIGNISNNNNDSLVTYIQFRQPLHSLVIRNERLGRSRLSIHADLLKQRNEHSGVDFRYLMQADCVLFIRSRVDQKSFSDTWYPVTLLYAGNSYNPFEIFARAESKEYFEKIKILMNIQNKDDLSLLKKPENRLQWNWIALNINSLISFEKLATRP